MALRKKRFYVSQDDINNGCQQESRFCPVALAMERSGLRSPRVGTAVFKYEEDGLLFKGLTPEAMRSWIHAFDNDREVFPTFFEFHAQVYI